MEPVIIIHYPKKPLIQFVDHIIFSNYSPTHTIERLIPDGSCNLILELGEIDQFTYNNEDLSIKEKYTHSWISGIQSSFISISAKNQGMMVVRFSPIGAHLILGIDLKSVYNKVIPASEVFNYEIDDLRDQILTFSSLDKRIKKMESWLSSKIKDVEIQGRIVQFLINQSLADNSFQKISQYIDKTGYSHKQVTSIFKKYLGTTPKQYLRILRFNQVLDDISNNKKIEWNKIIYRTGYYDQSHFIKEFKEFSGMNPNKFLTHKGEFINYVPVE